MEFYADENGITVKKLLGKTEITYPEIQSIINSNCLTTINLKSGKSYNRHKSAYLTDDFPVIFDAIEKYNIEFKDTVEESYAENSYSLDEVRSAYSNLESNYTDIANAEVAEKLGPEYSVKLTMKEESGSIMLYICLTKNGFPADIPSKCKLVNSPDIPESFDELPIALLFEWDTLYRCGKYSLQAEFEDIEEGEKYIRDSISEFCEYYKDKTDD